MENPTTKGWMLRGILLIFGTVISCYLGSMIAAGAAGNGVRIQSWLIVIILTGLIIGIAITSISFFAINELLKPNSWLVFWLGTIAVVIASVTGIVAILEATPGPGHEAFYLTVAGVSGMIIGLFQWLLLREKPVRSLAWIIASMIGWLIPMYVMVNYAAGVE